MSPAEIDALDQEGISDAGIDGRRVEAQIRACFGIDGAEYLADSLGDALSTVGVLTLEEGRWLDDDGDDDE